MRVIPKEESADWWPHQCIVTGRGDTDLIDTGQDFDTNPSYPSAHVYLASAYIEALARDHLGMVSREEVDPLWERIDRLEEESRELHEQLSALQTLEGILGNGHEQEAPIGSSV